jgi:hypothetical protein
VLICSQPKPYCLQFRSRRMNRSFWPSVHLVLNASDSEHLCLDSINHRIDRRSNHPCRWFIRCYRPEFIRCN